jgi:hypothetical protein
VEEEIEVNQFSINLILDCVFLLLDSSQRTQVRVETCCANKVEKILLPLLLVGVFAKTF